MPPSWATWTDDGAMMPDRQSTSTGIVGSMAEANIHFNTATGSRRPTTGGGHLVDSQHLRMWCLLSCGLWTMDYFPLPTIACDYDSRIVDSD
eukprot:scaffold824_cov132-Chaetoceros_neogracile.AAC.20